ncbi:unnamed protein product [Symbiodinium sp. CCMP2456]|nr:unnamed protein product [Symbiodinium sp. CCMP2456]
MVTEFQRSSTKSTARDLRKAVADQAKARQELVRLRGNRTAYLKAWQTYIAQIMDLLDAQVKSQEAAATQSLARLAQLDGAPTDVEEVDSDTMVTDAIEAEQRLRQEQEEHQRDANLVLEALRAVKKRADEHVRSDRDGSRTPRRRSTEGDAEAPDKKREGKATPFKLGVSAQPLSTGPEAAETKPPFPKAHT